MLLWMCCAIVFILATESRLRSELCACVSLLT